MNPLNVGLAFDGDIKIKDVLSCLFSELPEVDKGNYIIKQAVKEAVRKAKIEYEEERAKKQKITLLQALEKKVFPKVSQNTEDFFRKVIERITTDEPEKKYVVLDSDDDSFVYFLNIATIAFMRDFYLAHENITLDCAFEDKKHFILNAMTLCKDISEERKELLFKALKITAYIEKEKIMDRIRNESTR